MDVVFLSAALVVGALFLLPRKASANPAGDAQVIAKDYTSGANTPRGIRNNNPGNIEYNSGTRWLGQIGSDGRYAIFDTAENGIRALAIVLFNYRDVHGITTVRGIISRWAPNSENDTFSYISAVSGALGVSPDAQLDLRLYIKPLVRAIIKHENGYDPYPESLIHEALLATGKIV
jgi:hypothetical protein